MMMNVSSLMILLIVISGQVPSASFLHPLNTRSSNQFHQGYLKHQQHCFLHLNQGHRNVHSPAKGNSEIDEETHFGISSETVIKPLLLIFLAQFLLFLGVGAIIPSIPLYAKEIGLSSAANGIVISAPAITLLLGSNVCGNYADMARKPAMLYGMAAIAIFDFGTATATSLVGLLLARLGLGAGRCLAEAGERGMLADLILTYSPQIKGRALAAQQVATAAGIALGAPLGGIVVEQYGPRAAFLCVSVAALIACALYWFLPETVTSETAAMDSLGKRSKPNRLIGKGSENGDWKRLLSMNSWRGLALCQCGATFGFAAKIASIPLLATVILPGGAVGTGILVSATGLSGIVGAPVGGWLTDQTSAKFTAIVSGTVSALGLILIPAALSLDTSQHYVLGLNDQTMAFCAFVLLWSLGASAQGPALTALAQELSPVNAKSTAMALPRATGDGTYIVAPFLLGVLADSSFLPDGAECAFAGVAILCGVLALAILTER